MISQAWVVEYSRWSDERGLFPWHIAPSTVPVSRLASERWDIVFTGSADEAWAKYEKLVTDWEGGVK